MDWNFLDDSTLWVGISFIIFVLLIIKPLSSFFLKKIDDQIKSLKKEIDEAKDLKAKAEISLNEHKEKQKNDIQYIDNLKVQAKKDAIEIHKKFEKDMEQALKRKELNYNLIIDQMEINLRNKLLKEIMTKTLKFTKSRIEKKITNKHTDNFINASLKKLPKEL